jgi:general stress protein YciG
MANTKDNNTQDTKGKQGFASTDKDKKKEIQSKGGQSSHSGSQKKSDSDESDTKSSSTGKGKQGFASMDEEKHKEIASKGGQASHSGSQKKSDDSDEDEEETDDDDNKTVPVGKASKVLLLWMKVKRKKSNLKVAKANTIKKYAFIYQPSLYKEGFLMLRFIMAFCENSLLFIAFLYTPYY